MFGTIFWMLLAADASPAQAPPVTQFDAQSTSLAAPAAVQETTLPVAADGHDRLTVPVSLGTSRFYKFLVDTGADRTSVSREMARELGLAERPRAILHSTTGRSEVRMAWLPELRVSGRSVRNIKAPMLAAEHIGADGILGTDSLRSQRVVFDFARGELSILSSISAGDVTEGTIVVRAKRKDGRLIVTHADVDGERVTVVLDTGSSLTVGNSALRAKLSQKGRLNIGGPVEMVSVTGGLLRGEMATVEELKIGGAVLEGLPIAFMDAHTFKELHLDRKPAILLGMNALRGFDQVTIDFAERKLSFVLPRARSPRPS